MHVHHCVLEPHNLSRFTELERNFSSGQSYFDLDNTFKVDTYQLSHKGSPRIPECVAYTFSKGIFPTQESNWGLWLCRQILY